MTQPQLKPRSTVWFLDGLNFEMQPDEREDQTLEVLHQVVETPTDRNNNALNQANQLVPEYIL
jgi:hypothetical protein